MSEKSFILSSSGLKNIVSEEKEFRFIFGETEITMSNVKAEFLSPIVSRIHQTDPTINSIQFKMPLLINKKNKKSSKSNVISENVINCLKELSEGRKIQINEDQSYEIRSISMLLGNNELYSEMSRIFPIDINEKNVKENFEKIINQINFIQRYLKEKMIDDFYKDFISTISRLFYLIDGEKIKLIPKNVLYEIVCNDELKIKSEDFLFDIINDIFENGDNEPNEEYPSIMDFYEEIDIDNLSESKFIEFFNKLDHNSINGKLWSKLRHRISKKPVNDEKREERYSSKTNVQNYFYDNNKANNLNGIINHLTNEFGGNVHNKGIVELTSSSQYSGSCLPKYAVDLNNKGTKFASSNEANSWLQYDFKNRKIRPTHYTITSESRGKGELHPQFWVIEGSNSGEEWKILDSRNNITILNGKSITHTFNIQENLGKDEYYRYLRIRQTGLNARNDQSNNGNILAFSALEYFGSMIQTET